MDHLGQIHIGDCVRIKDQKVIIHQVSKLNLSDRISKTLQLPRLHIVQMTLQINTFLISQKKILNLSLILRIKNKHFLNLIVGQP